MVRNKMIEWDMATGGTGKGFDMIKSKSGSTGLKYKVKHSKPCFDWLQFSWVALCLLYSHFLLTALDTRVMLAD